MILCSHPNCQTTAGCVCNRLDPKAARIAELEAALSAATAERDANGREAFTQRNLAQSHEKDAAHWRVLAEKHEAAREAAEAKAARLEEALRAQRAFILHWTDDVNGGLKPTLGSLRSALDAVSAALEA